MYFVQHVPFYDKCEEEYVKVNMQDQTFTRICFVSRDLQFNKRWGRREGKLTSYLPPFFSRRPSILVNITDTSKEKDTIYCLFLLVAHTDLVVTALFLINIILGQELSIF